MKTALSAALAIVAGVATSALADSIIVPPDRANLGGTGGLNTITRNAANPRSYQLMFDSSLLNSIPSGAIINGLSFRMHISSSSNFGPWTPAGAGPADWTDYEIRVGTPATTVASMSTTFANNFSGNEVLVHDGPLTLAEGFFPGDGVIAPVPTATPNSMSGIIAFQSGFTYTGGDLLFDIRHPGGTHTSSTGFVDGITTGGTAFGYGTLFRAISATTFTPTTGTFTTAYITQIHWIPTPASIALLGLAGLVAARRRR